MSLCADSKISVNCRLEIAAPGIWMRALACHWLAASFGRWPINPQASAVSSLCARTSVARHSASVTLTATQRAAHCQRLPKWKWQHLALWHWATGTSCQWQRASVTGSGTHGGSNPGKWHGPYPRRPILPRVLPSSSQGAH